jgi:hypothetical protein
MNLNENYLQGCIHMKCHREHDGTTFIQAETTPVVIDASHVKYKYVYSIPVPSRAFSLPTHFVSQSSFVSSWQDNRIKSFCLDTVILAGSC